jgi:hypothetical protein
MVLLAAFGSIALGMAHGEGMTPPQITAQEIVNGVIAAAEQDWLDDATRARW